MHQHNKLYYKGGKAILWGVMALLLFLSCRGKTSQMNFRSLNEGEWSAQNTLEYFIDSLSSSGTYVLKIAVRTSSAKPYPFRQLVMEVCQQWHPAVLNKVDTVACSITKSDGEVNGRGVSVYAYECPLDTLNLSKGDYAHVYVRHLMRKTPLPGVYNVGVLLEKIIE